MDTLLITLRWIHIAAGTIALVLAPLAMLTVKGGPAHRRLVLKNFPLAFILSWTRSRH